MTAVIRSFPEQISDPGEDLSWAVIESAWDNGGYASVSSIGYSLWTEPNAKELLRFFFNRFGNARVGRHKIAFIDDDGDIIKVPRNPVALEACLKEVKTYEDPYFYMTDRGFPDPIAIPVAACMMDFAMGWPFERMEKVVPFHGIDMPEWADHIDYEQVGMNSAGKIVAFDL